MSRRRIARRWGPQSASSPGPRIFRFQALRRRLNGGRRCARERPRDPLPHVAVVEVAVRVDGEPHVRVAKGLLRDGGAGSTDDGGAEGVARPVEGDVAWDGLRPDVAAREEERAR